MRSRPFLAFLACVLTVPLCARMLPGVHADSPTIAVGVGVLLGIVYLLIRPIFRFLTKPIGCLTLGLSGFAADCTLILYISSKIPGFEVESIAWAALCALLVNGVTGIVGG